MALTLVIATHPPLQGLLLTAGGLMVFIIAMMLLPSIKWPQSNAPGTRRWAFSQAIWCRFIDPAS